MWLHRFATVVGKKEPLPERAVHCRSGDEDVLQPVFEAQRNGWDGLGRGVEHCQEGALVS